MRGRVAFVGALVAVGLGVTPGQSAAAVPHTVEPGETLWSIAAASNLTTRTLAAYNGLSEDSQVVLGSTIQIPSESEGAAALGGQPPAAAAPSQPQSPAPAPAPAGNGFASSGQVSQAAAQNGAAPSVATGIAYQESGFNNSMVSPAGARGVMQVMPDTWDFVENNLGAGPLDPNSTEDNLRAGSMYLDYLEGIMGDRNSAIAAYYQGPQSVRDHGILPETQRYIDNVLALSQRFGG